MRIRSETFQQKKRNSFFFCIQQHQNARHVPAVLELQLCTQTNIMHLYTPFFAKKKNICFFFALYFK